MEKNNSYDEWMEATSEIEPDCQDNEDTNTYYTVKDCLVFKIEELDNKNVIDMTAYILYDMKLQLYVIRGQRIVTEKDNSCTYSFNCNSSSDLLEFLDYVIDPAYKINHILYNYDNLPKNSNDITYEFLKKYDHQDYELSGYNNQFYDRYKILLQLKMLRNVYNYY